MRSPRNDKKITVTSKAVNPKKLNIEIGPGTNQNGDR